MKHRINTLLLLLSLAVACLCSEPLHAEPKRTTENLRDETVLLPSSAPDRGQLVPISHLTIGSENDTAGFLVLYDDPKTERIPDYVELYDLAGHLLLIHWVDQFGIHRTAIDKGLFTKESPKPVGVLILVNDGTPS